MWHWLTDEWVHCQLTHMEVQSQQHSTDTEIVWNELKHYATMLSATHSKGIQKSFHGGCGSKGCCQQVYEGASDAYALACEHRETFSPPQLMLNSSHSNFTADVENALLFCRRKRYLLTRHRRDIYLSVSFHRCHLASSAKQISWAKSWQCFYALTSN